MNDDLLQRWHDAVNAADRDGVRDVVADLVVVSGPKGAGAITSDALAEWITRSAIQLRPVAWLPLGDRVTVVEQMATWPESGEPRAVATMFRHSGNRVSAALRFTDLAQALAFAQTYVLLAANEG